MNRKRIIPYFLVMLLLLTLGVTAQEKKQIELLNAEELVYDETLGNKAQRLIGKVQFRHEGALMFCDSAYLYDDNKLDAFGKVHIQKGDSTHLYGDSLAYDGNTKLARLKYNVNLVDKDINLTTDSMDYDMSRNIGHYPSKGKIVSKDNVLTSESGYYYSNERSLYFKKNVVLTNPKYTMTCDTLKYQTSTEIAFFVSPTRIKSKENLIYCENGYYDTRGNKAQFSKNAYILTKNQKLSGDSLYYDRNTGFGKAMRNVEVIDSSQNMIIKGQLAEFFQRNKKTMVTGKAVFMQIHKEDTLFLHADTLRHQAWSVTDTLKKKTEKTVVKKGKNKKKTTADKEKKTEEPEDTEDTDRMIYAYRHVKFYRENIQGKCDSMFYSTRDSLMKLFGEPVLWSDKNQITGEKIQLKMAEGKIMQLHIPAKAFINEQVDSSRFNQIKGKVLTGHFKDNELVMIDVKGNGQTIYYAREDKGGFIGVNKAECTDLRIYVENNEVKKISFYKKPTATLYPISEADPLKMRLEGFIWLGSKRPQKPEDIFIW